MNKPLISIVTVSFNSESTIEETIQSVVNQNYDNFEYIIVDGGSTDSTLSIINKYKDKIAVIISEKDNGISDAFNKGIKIAKGEIIGIINSDDLLEVGALNKIAEYYSPSIDIYSGDLYFWNSETDKIRLCRPTNSFKHLRAQYSVCHPSRFIRKDAYDKWGGYDINLRYKMDVDLLVRFYKNGASFIHIPVPLARFRLGGTTADNIAKKKNDFYLFVTNNGWSTFDFKVVWLVSRLRNYAKKTLIKLGYNY